MSLNVQGLYEVLYVVGGLALSKKLTFYISGIYMYVLYFCYPGAKQVSRAIYGNASLVLAQNARAPDPSSCLNIALETRLQICN